MMRSKSEWTESDILDTYVMFLAIIKAAFRLC